MFSKADTFGDKVNVCTPNFHEIETPSTLSSSFDTRYRSHVDSESR